MSPSLAARCQQVHAAAERGDAGAGARLRRLAAAGPRAGQCLADLMLGQHRHAGRPGQLDCCADPSCPEASGAAWAASWESWWPPGRPPASGEPEPLPE